MTKLERKKERKKILQEERKLIYLYKLIVVTVDETQYVE
jgi:hypothetical protein